MGLLYYFTQFIFTALHWILYAYMWIIIVKALLSWVNPDPYNPIIRFINDVTEPFLRKLRVILPLGGGLAFDFSPIIAIVIILLAMYILTFIDYSYIVPLFLPRGYF